MAAAPWWGGLFEILVRSTERCLKKCLGRSRLTHEEIITLLAEIEAVINNRPLTFLYEEPGDQPVTPNHSLFGRKLNFHVNTVNTTDKPDVNFSQRFKYISTVLQHYRQRWKSEYLTELREFHKSRKSYGDIINEGDVVIIDTPNLTRALWVNV